MKAFLLICERKQATKQQINKKKQPLKNELGVLLEDETEA